MDDADEAARRLIAIDEGAPDADDEIDYLDAISVAREYLAHRASLSAAEKMAEALTAPPTICCTLYRRSPLGPWPAPSQMMLEIVQFFGDARSLNARLCEGWTRSWDAALADFESSRDHRMDEK